LEMFFLLLQTRIKTKKGDLEMNATTNEDQIRIEAWERMGFSWSYGGVFQIRGMVETSHQVSGHNLRQTYWDTKCNDCDFETGISIWDFDTDRYSLTFDKNLIIEPTR